MEKARNLFQRVIKNLNLRVVKYNKMNHEHYIGVTTLGFHTYLTTHVFKNHSITSYDNFDLTFIKKPNEFNLQDDSELRELFHHTNITIKNKN